MFNQEGYSLSDIAAVNGNDGFGGNGGAWWIIILFLFCFMGCGGNGFNGMNKQSATTDDVQNQFNFAALERQNNETVAAVRQGTYDTVGAVKDMGYMNNSSIRDIEQMVASNAHAIDSCCCTTQRNIDSLRYDNALSTKELLASNCEQTQKILDAISTNRIADMQNQINELQLQNAVAGVVRYPSATTFNAGFNPYFGSNGCCCN